MVDGSRPGAVGRVTELVVQHLRRHAANPASVAGASGLATSALAGLKGRQGWARLEWEGEQPALTVSARPAAGLPMDLTDDSGVWPADLPTETLAEWFSSAPALRVSLPVSRAPTVDIDPPAVAAPGGAGFIGAVASGLASGCDRGMGLGQAAAAAGATAARVALEDLASAGAPTPADAGAVAEAFSQFVNGAGGGFHVIDSGERRAVLANKRCPFGSGDAAREDFCRVTSALLGSLAAQALGRPVTVVLDEAIALGDTRCRAVLDTEGEPSPWGHNYRFSHRSSDGAGPTTPGFRVAVSLQLPRDRLTVPLVRHLVRHALVEVGAVDDDVHALEIAVSEAVGNVVRHAGRGDAYQVEVTVGPDAVELRVLDVGRGFDSETLLNADAAGGGDETGRGISLMNALVDQARFTSSPERGTIVHLVKRLHFDDQSPARRLMLSQLNGERMSCGEAEPH